MDDSADDQPLNERARQRHTEESLVGRARDGDHAALEELLERLYDQMFAVCRRICPQQSDAEDATQEALISVVRALGAFDGRSSVRTWAHRIATNAALDELRRRSRRPEPADLDDPSPRVRRDDEPALDERVGDRLDIDAALSDLPTDFRAAVVLRDVVGMEYADIAETLGVPIGTVRSRIARGRRQLADSLGIGNRSTTPSVSTDET